MVVYLETVPICKHRVQNLRSIVNLDPTEVKSKITLLEDKLRSHSTTRGDMKGKIRIQRGSIVSTASGLEPV